MPSKHDISLQEAIDMTKRYRSQKESITSKEFQSSLPWSETFDKSAFEELINQPGCASIRCYFGLDESNLVRLILVAVNSQDDDILPPTPGASVKENGTHCPPICSLSVSPLNS